MEKRVLLIWNCAAGAHRPSEDPRPALSSLGMVVETCWPDPKVTVSELIVQHQHKVDLVVLAGGDGTLNAAIAGLLKTGLPLGVIPQGTANDLARTLNIPTETTAACDVIAHGQPRWIDVGEVNGKFFLNVASLGLSASITRALTPEQKKAWGAWAYVKTAMQVVRRARPFHAEIEHDGEVLRVKTMQIAVGNGRHYGGGMTVSENAAIDDQLLDLYSLEVQHWWQIVFLIWRLRTGTLAGSKFARTLRAKNFTIRTSRPRSINTDGEITTETPATFQVVPRAIQLFVASNP